MSREYRIGRLPEGIGRYELTGVFDPAKLGAPYNALWEAHLDEFPWDENGYKPDVRARAGWNEKGLHVLMYANEPVIRAQETRTGGDVFLDSCMEWFLMPDADKPLYFNCEVSPRPAVHLGIGVERHGRTVYDELPEGMNVVSSRHEGGWWAVSYTVPADFLREVFGLTLASGLEMRGNFYKCGDGTDMPHYGMFKGYFDVEQPDYHRPERFARFVTE